MIGYWIIVLILRFLENKLTPHVGSNPFYVTAFHDGVDGLRLDYLEVSFTSGATIRCDMGEEMDDHQFLKLNCS